MGIRSRLAGFAAILFAWCSGALAQSAVTGTEYTLFWRGDLRIIATRPNTQVTILDAGTGLPLALLYTSNIAGNPVDLPNAGDSFEANNGTSTYRIRVIATRSRGNPEDKPIIVWTGALEPGIKHPAAPPTTGNAWMSILPALAPGSVENGSEIGREFWGFASEEAYVFARRGPQPTSIQIEDVVTNVDFDSDDTQVVTLASASRIYSDFEIEVYHVTGFEDDTIHVTANTDISIWTGIGATVGNDWTVTPPSWGAGEDARELGTLFYAFVSRDLTIFPTQDNTNVTITDLTDGDDSATVTLQEGDLNGNYDIFLTDTYARNGTGVAGRPAGPAVRLNLLGPSAPFDYDVVKVEADKPILLYIGPKSSDTFEYADVAYTLQTGPTNFLLYCYAQNGGAEDLQLFAQSQTTNVTITSLTVTQGFGASLAHDFSIPTPTRWLGGNSITNDWYWASGAWNGELLRIQADGPISVIDGDYDGPNFGCFIPFIANSGLLRPIADAGPDLSICPGMASIQLDGSRSFDTDTTPGAASPTWTWDTSPAADTNGDGNYVNDPDLVGEFATFVPSGAGPWTITLTYTDDDGQTDTDFLTIDSGDTTPPVIDCPVSATGDADATGFAQVAVLATATDNCPAAVTLVNDRTPNGADATDLYPCGETLVTFTGTDVAGNRATCLTRVIVRDSLPPDLACAAQIDADADATGFALVNVLATSSDPCGIPNVVNDRTPNGADATDLYPCGETLVTFTSTDIGGNVAQCTTRVVVHDAGPPVLTCLPRIDAPPDSATGATVPVSASAADACDPVVVITNDRTANGADATDFYPCGETPVTFTASDTLGFSANCTTLVAVAPPVAPAGISPALRVIRATGLDPHATAHLVWSLAADPLPWEHYEVRRTATDDVRPYPLVLSDVTYRAKDWIDPSATGRLWYYQVHVVDCAGATAPNVMALSP